jgi:hemerythrin-like domain-containing protein
LGVRYLSAGSLSSQEIDTFRTTMADFRSMYERHISLEDGVVFPLAARVLSDRDKSAIADEMAGRRKVKVVAAIGGAPGGL